MKNKDIKGEKRKNDK